MTYPPNYTLPTELMEQIAVDGLEAVPEMIGGFLKDFTSSQFLLLMIIALILIITGMFLESIAQIILLTPLMLPIAVSIIARTPTSPSRGAVLA